MLLLGSAVGVGGAAGNRLGGLMSTGGVGVNVTFLVVTFGVRGVACSACGGLRRIDLTAGDAGVGAAFGTSTGSAVLVGPAGLGAAFGTSTGSALLVGPAGLGAAFGTTTGFGGGGAAAFGSSARGTIEDGRGGSSFTGTKGLLRAALEVGRGMSAANNSLLQPLLAAVGTRGGGKLFAFLLGAGVSESQAKVLWVDVLENSAGDTDLM